MDDEKHSFLSLNVLWSPTSSANLPTEVERPAFFTHDHRSKKAVLTLPCISHNYINMTCVPRVCFAAGVGFCWLFLWKVLERMPDKCQCKLLWVPLFLSVAACKVLLGQELKCQSLSVRQAEVVSVDIYRRELWFGITSWVASPCGLKCSSS